MKKLHMARMFVLAVLFASGCALGMEEGGPEAVPVEAGQPPVELSPRKGPEEGGVDPAEQEQQQLRDRLQVVIDRLNAVKDHVRSSIKSGVDSRIEQLGKMIQGNQSLTNESVVKEEEYATFAEKRGSYAFQAKLAAQRTGSAVAGGIKRGAEWVKGKAVGAARKTKEAVASGYEKSKAYKAKVAAGAAVTGVAAYFGPRVIQWTQAQIAKNPAAFEYFSKRNLAIAVGVVGAFYGGYKAVGRKRKGKIGPHQALEEV